MSPPARAVLPVIGVYARESGRAWPGMTLISKFSGYSDPKRVRLGVRSLRARGLIEKGKAGRHNEYYLKGNALWKAGSYFPVYKEIIKKGLWAGLLPREKAVFPVLAVKAAINSSEVDREDNEHGFGIFSPSTMTRLSGVSRNSFYRAIHGLCEKGWIYTFSEFGERLYGESPSFYASNGYIVYQEPIRDNIGTESFSTAKMEVA